VVWSEGAPARGHSRARSCACCGNARHAGSGDVSLSSAARRGVQGEFTKTAAQRAPANTGFATGIDKPRVHKDAIP
jgi:hypothetical protein